MLDAFRGRSYYSGEEFVVVSNIRRADGGIRFDVHATPLALPSAANHVSNPGLDANAAGWRTDGWNPWDAAFAWEPESGRGGSGCVSIAARNIGVDAFWEQTVTGLTAGMTYELRGWIKGENIRAWDPLDASTGANLTVWGPDRSSWIDGMGTFDWKPFQLSFTAETSSARIGCRLGHHSSLMMGKAWFDDLSIVRLAYVPDAGANPPPPEWSRGWQPDTRGTGSGQRGVDDATGSPRPSLLVRPGRRR
jgi:hypothetical protein